METRIWVGNLENEMSSQNTEEEDQKPIRSGLRKGGLPKFEPTQDVLVETLEDRKQRALVVGFALEVGDGVDRARQKLEKKRLDLVVLNRADEPGSGFESETNRVTLVTASEEAALERMPKGDVAERILDAVERLL